MNEKKPDKSYDLEPAGEETPDQSGDQPTEADPEAELQDEETQDNQAREEPVPKLRDKPSDMKALDICPNCGSPLGGVDTVVCLRCGFDFKTLKVIKVETGKTTVPESEEAEPAAPLSVPGAGDLWLPTAMAAVGLGVLGIGYLGGAQGLFAAATTVGEEAVGFGKRLEGLVGMLVRTSVLTLAGLGGLSVLAHMLDTRLGSVKLAAVRMLGISAAIGLLAFFNVESIFLELTIEAVCQAIAFVGLAMVLFGLTVRDAATLMGLTVFAMIGLLLLSALVLWSAGPQA